MNLLEQQVIEEIRALHPEQQRAVLDFVKLLKAESAQTAVAAEPKRISFAEAAQKYRGCVEGPGDLSTNPTYMEGYGS